MPSIHLHAGAAFARGLEVARLAWYTGAAATPDDAIAAGWGALAEAYGSFDDNFPTNKTCARMGEALVSYFDEYPLDTDVLKPAVFNNRPAVEFRFAVPLPIENPSTGDPILYTGRFDMLGEKDAQLFVVDEKTTGSLGEYWSARYELSSQFTGYCWAAKEYGYPVVGAIIRGIGLLKYDIKHAQIPLYRPDWMIEEWYRTLLHDIRRMILAYEKWRQTDGWDPEVWEPNLADECGSFGGCEYRSVCGIAPEVRDKLLEINFVKRPWDPLGDSDDTGA